MGWARVALTAGLVPAIAAVAVPWSASASPDEAIDGRFVATSIGNMAKTNDAFKPEALKQHVWTVATTCDLVFCSGTVTSDEGWTAPITKQSDIWLVKRAIPNWGPCPDGTPFPAEQTYRFTPTGPDGRSVTGSPVLSGEEYTTGASGACGIGQPIRIRMPFRLDRIE